jgi:hypothetical protein
MMYQAFSLVYNFWILRIRHGSPELFLKTRLIWGWQHSYASVFYVNLTKIAMSALHLPAVNVSAVLELLNNLWGLGTEEE